MEIWKTLKDIGDLKARGIDGYGAKFFKSTWSIVKSDLIVVCNGFFENGRMLNSINRILVTLISKTLAAKTIKDYKPISYCTSHFQGVDYKVGEGVE